MSSGSDLRRIDAVYVAVAIVLATVMLDAGLRASNHPSLARLFVRVSASQPAPNHIIVPVEKDATAPPDPPVLRVCADPNNLPFTNARGEGFENAIAALVARDLGRRLEYYWQPQRRGFVRTTLKAGKCDVIMGVPSNFEMARPTRPYYRSTYVFVSRSGRVPGLHSFDDPRLPHLRIGIQITGEDYENPPAAHALAARHLIDNVRGYTVYGDYSKPDPQREIVDAVADDQIDTAVVWGPFAGYFAGRERVPLDVAPVTPQRDSAAVPFVFDISMGVRRQDAPLHDALDRVIARREPEIRHILRRFRVPLVGAPPATETTNTKENDR